MRVPGSSALSGLLARLGSLWSGVFRRADVEAEMREEFRHHIALRTEDLIRHGLPPAEAARRARIEFGHIESHRENACAARGLRLFDRLGVSWLDVKLGIRMLAKYPWLSLVSVAGMAVAIAIGAGGFGIIHALMDAPLPLDEGERVVSLQNSDATNPGSPDRHALHDFLLWREQLGSVRDLSAFTDDVRMLAIPGGGGGLVEVARMTASGFRVARVAPVLGRPLLDEDEREGAPPVIVIAYEEWQGRFGGDSAIIGRTVRLDDAVHTVVGVMPEGFRFPVDHRYWVPLRLDPAADEVGGGPEIWMFGRLADGVSLEQAQAELTTIGRRMATAHPATHERLRPWIRPYTHAFVGVDSPARAWEYRAVQIGLSLLLIVVAVNVAALVYARTAARTGEIAVRTALGASRRRVVTQLFTEALVLSLAAAVIGLAIAEVGFEWIRALATREVGELPFWIDLRLSPVLVAYVLGLAILAGVIVGVVPPLQATGRSVQGSLQRLSSRGSGMQLGRTWTALIVTQVAIAVAALPYALYGAGRFARSAAAVPDYPVDEFVHASFSIAGGAVPAAPDAANEAAIAARFAASAAELLRRIEAEPAVAGGAFASHYPGSEPVGQIEVEGAGTRSSAWFNEVDVDLFTVFDVPVLAGRGFVQADAARGANTAIVDRVFAERVLGDGNVIGRRVRRVERGEDGTGEVEAGPWLEIVGVVPAFTPPPPFESAAPKLYQPLALADARAPLHLGIRMRRGAAPAAFVGRLREAAHAADPALRFVDLGTASQEERGRREGLLALALLIAAVTASVLLLSAAGIYAMMSFTVATRRREIGIRAALGADPRRILTGIFRRAARQLGAGVLAGLVLAEAGMRVAGGSWLRGEGAHHLPIVAAIMVAIGLLAALGPARRGLAVQPAEVLHEE
ncbi:MAG TPA: ABC transporter permease [Longimicrobiales bacterium]